MTISTSQGTGTHSEPQLTVRPRRYTADGSRRAILVCPPHGQTAAMQIEVGWIGLVVAALARAGFCVMASDMGGVATFGNAAAATAVGNARSYAQATLGAKAGKVGLLATSMGMLEAMRYSLDNPANVGAVVGGVPAVDLRSIHDVTRTDLAASIESAHGGAGPYASYLTNYNPRDHASSYSSLPIQLHYATNDPSIDPATVGAFAAGSGAQTISLGAVGHSPATVDPITVVKFFAAHL